MGLVTNNQAYDVLQILKNYQHALHQNKQEAESGKIGKIIEKYEVATKAGQMNGNPPEKAKPGNFILCGNDPMIEKLRQEGLAKERETLKKIIDAADREHIR